MRKYTAMILFLLAMPLMCVWAGDMKDSRFTVQLNGGFLFPADGNYKDVYGGSVFYPGIRGGYRISGSIDLWLGYDYLNKNGTTPVLEEEAKSTQHLIALGVGYQGNFSEKAGYRLQAGVVYFSYKEEALDETVSDSAVGFRLDGELIVNLGKRLFAGVSAGYRYGSDTVEGAEIKLGGFVTGILVGIKL